MRPLRLAIVSSHPIQYYAPLFGRLAAATGLEVHVFYGWSGAAAGPSLDPGFGREVHWDVPLLDGYRYTFLENVSLAPGASSFGGIHCPGLVPSVSGWGPDAVLVVGWSYRSHLAAMRAFNGRVPVLFRGDSTLLDEQRGLRRVARTAFLRWVYTHVDLAFYVGKHNHAYFRRHGLGEERLQWAPHAVDNDRFSGPEAVWSAEAARLRARMGIPPEAKVVVFTGKLEAKKAPDLLLRAAKAMDGRQDVHLVFAGSGPMEAELRAAAGGDVRVHFLGFQNQSIMPGVYRVGDVMALPSRGPGETWGLSVNEALACGVPVVVSDRVGCAPDLVEGGDNGRVFASGDADALRAALSGLLTDPERLKNASAAARRRVAPWSIAAAAESIEKGVGLAVSLGSGSRRRGRLPVGRNRVTH